MYITIRILLLSYLYIVIYNSSSLNYEITRHSEGFQICYFIPPGCTRESVLPSARSQRLPRVRPRSSSAPTLVSPRFCCPRETNSSWRSPRHFGGGAARLLNFQQVISKLPKQAPTHQLGKGQQKGNGRPDEIRAPL